MMIGELNKGSQLAIRARRFECVLLSVCASKRVRSLPTLSVVVDVDSTHRINVPSSDCLIVDL